MRVWACSMTIRRNPGKVWAPAEPTSTPGRRAAPQQVRVGVDAVVRHAVVDVHVQVDQARDDEQAFGVEALAAREAGADRGDADRRRWRRPDARRRPSPGRARGRRRPRGRAAGQAGPRPPAGRASARRRHGELQLGVAVRHASRPQPWNRCTPSRGIAHCRAVPSGPSTPRLERHRVVAALAEDEAEGRGLAVGVAWRRAPLERRAERGPPPRRRRAFARSRALPSASRSSVAMPAAAASGCALCVPGCSTLRSPS